MPIGPSRNTAPLPACGRKLTAEGIGEKSLLGELNGFCQLNNLDRLNGSFWPKAAIPIFDNSG
jgi:hypothetical protein